jgi:hypothetical protein
MRERRNWLLGGASGAQVIGGSGVILCIEQMEYVQLVINNNI